jgi:hypothetical protein
VPGGSRGVGRADGAQQRAVRLCGAHRSTHAHVCAYKQAREPLHAHIPNPAITTILLLSHSYVSSQPWPFPRSLMVGFMAEALPAAAEGSGAGAGSAHATAAAAAAATVSSNQAPAPAVAAAAAAAGTASAAATNATAAAAAASAAAAAAAAAAAVTDPLAGLSRDARRAVVDSGITPTEVAVALSGSPLLQPTRPQEGEMQDVRWFHR